MRRDGSILALNAGSSSVKFALYRRNERLTQSLRGTIERIGRPDARLSVDNFLTGERQQGRTDAADHRAAARAVVDVLGGQLGGVLAVGHRIVHGMQHVEPTKVTSKVVDDLRRLVTFDPDHLPLALALIDAFAVHDANRPQVACFDTAFHRTLPRVAQVLPIPRRYDTMGVRRYGFHGLSYAYLMESLERLAGRQAAHGRVILAHLGSGASMAACVDGKSIDTSMGFTPAGGFPMGTRPGDLDPGVVAWLFDTERLDADGFTHLVNHESGLLGLSETSADMRDLLAAEGSDVRAAEAVAVFCYQARKWLGAFAAALGGVDTLVFSGGIGEHAPPVRERICARLGFLGIAIDPERNADNAGVISKAQTPVTVRVMHTDEEWMIATTVCRVLGLPISLEPPL